jgi:chromate reductase, NAD(P)H dehydrogenase (quinone)
VMLPAADRQIAPAAPAYFASHGGIPPIHQRGLTPRLIPLCLSSLPTQCAPDWWGSHRHNVDLFCPRWNIVVGAFRDKLAQADAILIATLEYNSSITGALKNALDWASRSPQPPLQGKPAAIMGASTGNFGTLRAQLHLRQILTHVGALPLGKPEVLVARAKLVFDAEGKLVDAATRGFLRDLLVTLAKWIKRLSP